MMLDEGRKVTKAITIDPDGKMMLCQGDQFTGWP